MSNIFDVVNDEDVVTIDENVDYVAELVGDGKKFKDLAALARGKAEADKYIELQNRKLDQLKQELNTRTSLEGFLEKMKTPQEHQPPQPVAPPSDAPVMLDDSMLEAKLAALLEKKSAESKQETNYNKVVDVLVSQYGDQANLVINHKAKEVGMTPQELKSLASRSPEAFFRLTAISTDAHQGSGSPVPRSGLNTIGNTGSTVRNAAFYEKMKLTDPKKYNDPKTASEMMKDLAECRAKGLPW